MHYEFSNGAICYQLPMHKKLYYDMANLMSMCQVDGTGSISKYSIANRYSIFQVDSHYLHLTVNEKQVTMGSEKSIELIGRVQKLSYDIEGWAINQEIFMDDTSNAVYISWGIEAKENNQDSFRAKNYDLELPSIGINMGYILADECPVLSIASNAPIKLREREGNGYHYSLNFNGFKVLMVLSGGEEGIIADTEKLLKDFDGKYANAKAYIRELKTGMPKKSAVDPYRNMTEIIGNEDEKDINLRQALFVSSRNCALSMYKEVDGFAGFFAGIHYQAPARTYYRDSYYTCLPLIGSHPNLIRSQILTLSRGIDINGEAPSGVKVGYEPFWRNHIDSPAYFILLISAYINETQDLGILQEESKEGNRVLDLMALCIEGMVNRQDTSGLIYRESFNRHDWADNIYRCGYVTYIQALFYESLRVCGIFVDKKYTQTARLVKEAINEHLWSEEKGYYVNYKDKNYCEDNLSIDTVLIVKFGIADETRALRTLENMTLLLESKNNESQLFGDWGVLCAYPFYKYKEHLVEKSSYDYVYHNGSDWPYLSALYAYVKKQYGMDYDYPLTRWFTYGLEQGWTTPVEYYNPITGRGSNLQGWSGMALLTLLDEIKI